MIKKFLTIAMCFLFIFSCKKQEAQKSEKELTIFGMFNNIIFDENWPVFQKAKEDTGITLKGKISQNASDEREAFNLMIASGDLPDIIRYSKPKDLDSLGADGGLIPLEELIDEYAPNIKKFWDENPQLKKEAVAIDGKIYYIPYHTDSIKNKAGRMYFIRKDWLDKLNIPVPKTIDDFYTTLVAFKNNDPNGNGKRDEVPFFNRINDITRGLEILFSIFQINYPWYLTFDNDVVFAASTEKFKNAVIELNKWYKEGLIDPEYFTRDLKTAREYFLGNDLGGVTIDWPSTATYMDSLKGKVPNLNLIVIPPPEINGVSKMVTPRQVTIGGWGISSKAKDPVTAIKYFDYWFTPEGRRLWNFGIEGVEYTMVNGSPVFTDSVLKNPEGKTSLAVLYSVGAQWEIGVHQDYEYEKQVSLPVVVEGYNFYADNNIVEDIIFSDSLKYTREELREFSRLDAQLKDYSDEMSQKWIMGASDINKDWDNFLKRLDSLGLQKAIDIQKKALERYNNG